VYASFSSRSTSSRLERDRFRIHARLWTRRQQHVVGAAGKTTISGGGTWDQQLVTR